MSEGDNQKIDIEDEKIAEEHATKVRVKTEEDEGKIENIRERRRKLLILGAMTTMLIVLGIALVVTIVKMQKLGKTGGEESTTTGYATTGYASLPVTKAAGNDLTTDQLKGDKEAESPTCHKNLTKAISTNSEADFPTLFTDDQNAASMLRTAICFIRWVAENDTTIEPTLEYLKGIDVTYIHWSRFDETAQDLKRLYNHSYYFPAMVLNYAAAKAENSLLGNEAVEFRKITIQDMKHSFKKYFSKITGGGGYRKNLAYFMIFLMKDVLHEIELVKNAPYEFKVESQAWGLSHIATCYGKLMDREKQLQTNIAAIDLMEQEFGTNSTKYRIYGFCNENAVRALYYLGEDYHTMLDFYKSALQAYQSATDFADEEKRKEHIQRAEKYISKIRDLISTTTSESPTNATSSTPQMT